MAPSSNVTVRPNDWAKAGQQSAKAATTVTPTRQLRLKFWTGWFAWRQAGGSALRPQKPQPQQWTNIALGRAGIHLAATVHSRGGRIEMADYIDHANSKGRFKQLLAHKDAIEAALQAKLDWQALPDGHACSIQLVRPDSPLEDEVQRPVYFAWLAHAGLRMTEMFRHRARAPS